MIPGGPMQYSRQGLALTEGFEGLYLSAYPDPASPLARKLQAQGTWNTILDHCRKGIPFVPVAGDPPGDPWTIGYGHTGPDVHPGLVWTPLLADQALARDMGHAVACVNAMVSVALTQGEFDALTDMAFNAGVGALQHSTLLKLLNEGNFTGAANEFDKWDRAGGREVAGLLRRREAETKEFSGG